MVTVLCRPFLFDIFHEKDFFFYRILHASYTFARTLLMAMKRAVYYLSIMLAIPSRISLFPLYGLSLYWRVKNVLVFPTLKYNY